MPFHKVVVVCFLFLVGGSLPVFSQCPPPDPIATGDASCTPKSFTLSAFNSTDTYNWYDAGGTLVSQGDFYTTPIISITTTYYVTSFDSGNNCESEKVAVQLVILPDTGTPSVYGSDQWFAYCFNGITWTTYKGFYVDNTLSIHTAALWDPLLSPNNGTPQVAGYIGCPVNVDNHSISYKRQGFPPDVYRIDITEQNDDFTLLIDGVVILQRESYGQVYPAVWTGKLDANSKVEYKWLDRGGQSSATVNFVATGVPTDLYAGRIANNQAYCLTGNPSAFADSAAYVADRNAYVQSGTATPTPGQLLVNANAPANIMQAYVSFDISSVRTSSFNNAFLYVHAYDMSSYPNTTLFAYSTDTTWDESSISWVNQPAASSLALNSTTVYDINQQWYKIDVSSFILGERNAGHTRASFLLNDTVSANNPLPFYDRTTAYPPLLVLNNKRGGCTGYTYQWQSSVFCNNTWSDIPGATSLNYTAPSGLTDSTCYRLQVTDACSSVVYSNTLHINIDPPTVAGTLTVAEADPTKGTIQVGGEVGQVLHWEVSQDDFATVNTALNTTSTQINYTGSTTSDTYYRALIRSGVCSQLYTDTVKILKVQDFTIFNSFSPNGDGLNDVWKISGIERYPDNNVSIVNFMGVPVYEASHYNNEDVVWNGQGGGQHLPDGTYYYSIQIPDKPTLTGYVVIKR